jgi:hypothetical protein
MRFGKNFNWTKNDNQTMFGWNRSGAKEKYQSTFGIEL